MNGWDEFLGYITAVRARMEDGWAPVGLICLQARDTGQGEVQVLPEHDGAIVWPASFPPDQRGPLLRRLAIPYAEGTVLRG